MEDAPLNEILSLAQQLIQIPSTADNIAALNETVLLIEEDLKNFSIQRFVANGKPSLLIHNGTPNTKQFKILLNAHVDVVQADSFIPRIRDGRLYGRGAYDMKAAAAAMIVLFNEIANRVRFPLALQITTDEETGSHSAKIQIDEGYRADFIITGECGNNFMITNQAKGVYHIKLTATGTSSHGAYPWLGDNAIMKLHEAIDKITKRYPLPKEESHHTTVNITRLRTLNEVTNRTPDHAEAYLDIRYMPEDSNIMSEIKKLLPLDVTIETNAHYSPLNTSSNNTYIKLLQKTGQEVLQQPIKLRTAHATSDIVRFAEIGCDGVEFGPIGANQHGEHEWVDIKSLEDYYQILKQFLLSVK